MGRVRARLGVVLAARAEDRPTLDRHAARERPVLRRHARHGCGRAGELDSRRRGGEFRDARESASSNGSTSSTTERSRSSCRAGRSTRQWSWLIPTSPLPSGLPIRHGRSAHDPAGSHRPGRGAGHHRVRTDDRPRPPAAPPISRGSRRSAGSPGRWRGSAAHTRSGDARLRCHAAALSVGAARLGSEPTFFSHPDGQTSSPSLSEDARQALADDAVRGEARGAQGPFWWETGQMPLASSLRRLERNLPTPRIVYDANDGAARDLAERFVGLVRASGPAATTFLDAILPDRPRRTFQRATGLTGEDLANARRLGHRRRLHRLRRAAGRSIRATTCRP